VEARINGRWREAVVRIVAQASIASRSRFEARWMVAKR
jgi:hypothetical protein